MLFPQLLSLRSASKRLRLPVRKVLYASWWECDRDQMCTAAEARATSVLCFLSGLVVLAGTTAVVAQDPPLPLRLKSLRPAGVQSHLTESNGMLAFTVSNSTSEDKEVRLLTFYPERRRAGRRDAWIPAKATLSSWSCLAGPPSLPARGFVELKSFSHDRTHGRDQPCARRTARRHTPVVQFYRREPGTTLMLDVDVADGSRCARASRRGSGGGHSRPVRVFRHRMGWSRASTP